MNYRRLFIPNALVFITIVTSKRRKILIQNIKILREAFRKTINSFHYEIIAITVMPEHIHLIIKPCNIKDYPKIIQQMKRHFSQNIDKHTIKNYALTKSNQIRKEADIWQHRYYEHTIRDENDLYKHIDYIHYNSMKHYKISPKDWKYSSFFKFVKLNLYEENWCNSGDINKINELNCE